MAARTFDIATIPAMRARKRRAKALAALSWMPETSLPVAGLAGLAAAFFLLFSGYALARDDGFRLAGLMTDVQVEVVSRIAPEAGQRVAATTPQSAARFVERLGAAVAAVSADRTLAPEQREQALRKVLLGGFEVETIGRIALGRYWRGATPAQQAEYRRLFPRYLIDRIVSRFARHGRASIAFTDARPAKRNFVIIESRVTFPGRSSVSVDWLVRNAEGGPRVIDLIVNGLSLAVTQRFEFTAIIESHGGDLEGLLAALRRKTT
jgi:phospholipid transport system substrate-binding protein